MQLHWCAETYNREVVLLVWTGQTGFSAVSISFRSRLVRLVSFYRFYLNRSNWFNCCLYHFFSELVVLFSLLWTNRFQCWFIWADETGLSAGLTPLLSDWKDCTDILQTWQKSVFCNFLPLRHTNLPPLPVHLIFYLLPFSSLSLQHVLLRGCRVQTLCHAPSLLIQGLGYFS